ncbi:hypothetical protein BH09VER1_BH09VER1_19180 [soil metagenome]
MKFDCDSTLNIQAPAEIEPAKSGQNLKISLGAKTGVVLDDSELSTPENLLGLFSIRGEESILEEADLGIVNGRLTTNILYSKALSLRTLFAPPFVSSDFVLEGRVFGELLRSKNYIWNPIQVQRQASIRGIEVTSEVTLIEGQRALIFEIRLHNQSGGAAVVPLQFSISGGFDFATSWEFLRPEGKKACRASQNGNLLIRKNDTGVIILGLNKMVWEEYSSFLKTSVSLASGETRSAWLVITLGEPDDSKALALRLLQDPVGEVNQSRKGWARKAKRLLEQIPRFSAEDERLEKFYYRSALHLLLNRWETPEFVLKPFYATGSVNGGCICSYLWDFSEGAEIFPLADPQALKEHIKAFLRIDLTRHFSFNPLSGTGWGPWYYINQEKIVSLIHNYVLISGDKSFLREEVAGKTVIDWVKYQALFGDLLEEHANLIDYGSGNHHLELRREYRYDHYIPDLNARRYATYLLADTLCKLVGEGGIDLKDRAEKLKKLVREKMWSEKDQWWFYIDPNGRKDLRYTMQLFKLVGSGVFDEEERSMVDRLNEDEFLSEFGFHSISKKDPAYDQVDIDNGGGGACCCFPPQIVERLYKAGYAIQADDILSRILWWGDRLPYWSDSLVANAVDYRRDTPLQNAVGAVAGAQSIIFGMFGIKLGTGNTVTINPASPSFSPTIALKGLKIRGTEIAIEVSGDCYSVTVEERTYTKPVGTAIEVSVNGFAENERNENESICSQ